MKEETVESQDHGFIVCFEELKETKKSGLFDSADGAVDNLNHDRNERAGVVCLDEVKVDNGRGWLDRCTQSNTGKGNHEVMVKFGFGYDTILTVLWDFRKRKKSLRHLMRSW